jgi:hypothetical protein
MGKGKKKVGLILPSGLPLNYSQYPIFPTFPYVVRVGSEI